MDRNISNCPSFDMWCTSCDRRHNQSKADRSDIWSHFLVMFCREPEYTKWSRISPFRVEMRWTMMVQGAIRFSGKCSLMKGHGYRWVNIYLSFPTIEIANGAVSRYMYMHTIACHFLQLTASRHFSMTSLDSLAWLLMAATQMGANSTLQQFLVVRIWMDSTPFLAGSSVEWESFVKSRWSEPTMTSLMRYALTLCAY